MPEDLTTWTIVIPSRNRPALLQECLQRVRVAIEVAGIPAEIVVVDDGSVPALREGDLPAVTLVRGAGQGPARARNRGIMAATGSIVAFTDDDARVSPAWLQAAKEALDQSPGAVGVRGPVTTPPYDPLFEHSVEDLDGGRFLTCNVAYRREPLVEVGGFDPSYRFAHEDIDLGLRMAERGPVLFAPAMAVEHPGRPISVEEFNGRSRFVADDWLFFRRYPSYNGSGEPLTLAPLRIVGRRWLRIGRSERSISRFARWTRLSAGQLSRITWKTVRTGRSHVQRPIEGRSGLRNVGLRIAYVGPVPSRKIGGAPGVEGWIIDQLAAAGCSIDCYVPTSDHFEATDDISSIEGVRVVEGRSSFQFGRWYSRSPLTKMVSFQAFQALSRRRLAGVLLAEHEIDPYDVVYQASSIEAFGLPSNRAALPPLALHPSVHAAGELRWLRNEAALGERCGGPLRARGVRAWMALRARRQRTDIAKADRVLALSEVFGRHLVADYGVDPAKVEVLGNVIDVDAFALGESPAGQRATIVVLGRVVVRKGVEDIVALSHRLRDLADSVQMVIVGEGSLWSDYTPLLGDLDPAIATAVGRMDRDEVSDLLGSSRLLIQASHYEPFGLTVGEALACGVPVVATNEVGAAEHLDPSVCTVVPDGDLDALEAAVRAELARGPLDHARRARCREEVVRRYSAAVIGRRALEELTRLAQGG